jgi:predicted transcriptional regulator
MAKDRERSIAKELYVEQGKSGKEIAALIGVQEVTVSRWVTDGGWRAERNAKLNSSTSRLENIKKVIDDITEQRLNLITQIKEATANGDKEALVVLNLTAVSLDDGISKWNKTLLNVDKSSRIDLALYLEIMTDVFGSMRAYDEKLHNQTLDFQENHVQFMSKKLG